MNSDNVFQILTVALAVISLAGNFIAVGVVLYVKAQIAPMMVTLESQGIEIGSMKAIQREDIKDLWKEVGVLKEQAARAEARKPCDSKKVAGV